MQVKGYIYCPGQAKSASSRKKIKTCLADHPEILALLAAADIDPDARGETLDVQKFVTLANLWHQQMIVS